MLRYLLPLVIIIFSSCLAVLGQSFQSFQELQNTFYDLATRQGEVLFPGLCNEMRKKLSAVPPSSTSTGDASAPDHAEFEALSEALLSLNQFIEHAGNFFINALSVRKASLNLGADEFSEAHFAKAERLLRQAAQFYLNDKIKTAKATALQAESVYRKAQLEAVRNNVIGESRILLQESVELGAEKYAPKTYSAAQKLLSEVERLVNQKYTRDDLLARRSSALLASAGHLLELVHVLHRIYQAESNAETYLLALEDRIAKLSAQLNNPPENGSTVQEMLQELTASLKDLKQERDLLAGLNRESEDKRELLESELLAYKSQSNERLIAQRQADWLRSKLDNEVELNGEKVVIYFEALEFEPDVPEITPQIARELAPLIEALPAFPANPMEIRFVHYVAGDLAYHQNLAFQRAQAIKSYICKNSQLREKQFQFLGFANTSEPPYPAYGKYATCLEININLARSIEPEKITRSNRKPAKTRLPAGSFAE